MDYGVGTVRANKWHEYDDLFLCFLLRRMFPKVRERGVLPVDIAAHRDISDRLTRTRRWSTNAVYVLAVGTNQQD